MLQYASPFLPLSSKVLSSLIEDVLSHGDIVGEGIPLQDEPLRLVPSQAAVHVPAADHQEPAKSFEVVRKLGTGIYAVVYLVREVLCRSPSGDDHIYPGGCLEFDDPSVSRTPPTEYGREYAIKLTCKADFDEEELIAQFTEATNHQSVPAHPNIVTLHRILETSVYILLLLEFVPGQDLFYFLDLYFLDQARNHYNVDPASDPPLVPTFPTPGLLSSSHPSQFLSHTHLRLIASMFSQMCEAVVTCHDASVFHRDIKPENFIVTEGWTLNQDGTREFNVVVKLSDFGLSTRDAVSSDMDCGSAPYMSFECRNNLAPVYMPRAADVWSLGIVLINMLYHYNPWMDTATGECPSFHLYLSNPTSFLMRRFAGMTLPIANFLVENVFCILDDPTDDSQRICARKFGDWIHDLPTLMEASQSTTDTNTDSRVPSTSVSGHPLASAPASRRPSSRPASTAGRLPHQIRVIPHNSPVHPVLDHDGSVGTHPPTLYLMLNQGDEDEEQEQQREQQQAEDGHPPSVRSLSTTKRLKRGPNGKGVTLSTESPEGVPLSVPTRVRELRRQARLTSAVQYSIVRSEPEPYVSLPSSTPLGTSKGSPLSTASSHQSYYTPNTSPLSYSTTNSTSTPSSTMSFPYSVTSINSRKSRMNVLYPRRVHPLPVAEPSEHSLPPGALIGQIRYFCTPLVPHAETRLISAGKVLLLSLGLNGDLSQRVPIQLDTETLCCCELFISLTREVLLKDAFGAEELEGPSKLLHTTFEAILFNLGDFYLPAIRRKLNEAGLKAPSDGVLELERFSTVLRSLCSVMDIFEGALNTIKIKPPIAQGGALGVYYRMAQLELSTSSGLTMEQYRQKLDQNLAQTQAQLNSMLERAEGILLRPTSISPVIHPHGGATQPMYMITMEEGSEVEGEASSANGLTRSHSTQSHDSGKRSFPRRFLHRLVPSISKNS